MRTYLVGYPTIHINSAMLRYVPWAIWLEKSRRHAVLLNPQDNHCGKLANEITFYKFWFTIQCALVSF